MMAGLVPFNRRRSLLPQSNGRFDDFFSVMDDFFNETSPFRRSLVNQSFKLDVRENDNQYCVEAELPGVKKEEIQLELEDGRLTISVQRDETSEETKGNYIHRERRVGSMQRCLYLDGAVAEDVKASFKDGILEITVPKTAASEKKTNIEIE